MSFDRAFSRFPRLETSRLVLRAIEQRDSADLYHHFATLRTSPHWSLQHRNPGEARKHIEIIRAQYRERRLLWWAIATRAEDRVIGSCSLYDFAGKSRAEIGYWLSGELQGRGMATEAVREVVKYGFTTMELHRIQAGCHPRNLAAVKVAKKAGFLEEGILREYEPGKEGWSDSLVLAILKGDWEKVNRPSP